MDQDARLDKETGLYPQKMLESLLDNEVLRAKRYPGPVSVLYIALRFAEDPSKEVLDSARSFMADMLHAGLREVDIPGHYQGNYMVVMPESDIEGARKAAERLADKFRGKQVTRELHEYGVSICAGMASHPGGEGITSTELLSRASVALWEAHRRGPQQLVVFDEIKEKGYSQ
ncbi:MAG: diguanylate cyclase [Anaerolineales bacterium]|nr:diguanylate cyclase [Anaerolineales bacterium]